MKRSKAEEIRTQLEKAYINRNTVLNDLEVKKNDTVTEINQLKEGLTTCLNTGDLEKYKADAERIEKLNKDLIAIEKMYKEAEGKPLTTRDEAKNNLNELLVEYRTIQAKGAQDIQKHLTAIMEICKAQDEAREEYNLTAAKVMRQGLNGTDNYYNLAVTRPEVAGNAFVQLKQAISKNYLYTNKKAEYYAN